MTQETIDDFYTSLIKSTGCDVNDKGVMTVTTKNKTEDVTLNTNGTERVVRIPTYANLRDPCPDTTVFFHPLAENLERGKSEVFDMLHRRMVSKLNSVMTITGVGLLTLQLSPQLHTKFNKEQMEIMRVISDSDDKSALNWAQIAMHPVLKMSNRLDQWGINIFIKKKGKYQGQEYKRVGVTGFPAYEEIIKGERYYKTEGKDAKMIGRVIDYKTYPQVMEAIFPDIKTIGAYDAGYDGAVAPNLIAFLKAVEQIGSRLNYVSDTMADFFGQVGVDPMLSRMDLSWRNTINDPDLLASWLRKIPSLEGNAGRPDLRALKEERESPREERRDEPRKETRTEKREDPLPWEDDKRDTPTNKYGLSVSWAKKGGGNVKDLDEDRRRQREADLDEEERRRENLRRQRDEEDRARSERRRRETSREDDDREARRRERDAEERRARGEDRDDRGSDKPDDAILTSNGKLNFSAALRAKPEIARGTRTEEELRERERGSRRRYRDDRDDDRDYRSRRRYRDDYDDEYDDDDRDYRRRYRDDDRDYRDRYRDDRDDRDYRSRYRDDRDDRDYRDRYRDERDDRDYRGRDRGRGSGLRRLGWG